MKLFASKLQTKHSQQLASSSLSSSSSSSASQQNNNYNGMKKKSFFQIKSKTKKNDKKSSKQPDKRLSLSSSSSSSSSCSLFLNNNQSEQQQQMQQQLLHPPIITVNGNEKMTVVVLCDGVRIPTHTTTTTTSETAAPLLPQKIPTIIPETPPPNPLQKVSVEDFLGNVRENSFRYLKAAYQIQLEHFELITTDRNNQQQEQSSTNQTTTTFFNTNNNSTTPSITLVDDVSYQVDILTSLVQEYLEANKKQNNNNKNTKMNRTNNKSVPSSSSSSFPHTYDFVPAAVLVDAYHSILRNLQTIQNEYREQFLQNDYYSWDVCTAMAREFYRLSQKVDDWMAQIEDRTSTPPIPPGRRIIKNKGGTGKDDDDHSLSRLIWNDKQADEILRPMDIATISFSKEATMLSEQLLADAVYATRFAVIKYVCVLDPQDSRLGEQYERLLTFPWEDFWTQNQVVQSILSILDDYLDDFLSNGRIDDDDDEEEENEGDNDYVMLHHKFLVTMVQSVVGLYLRKLVEKARNLSVASSSASLFLAGDDPFRNDQYYYDIDNVDQEELENIIQKSNKNILRLVGFANPKRALTRMHYDIEMLKEYFLSKTTSTNMKGNKTILQQIIQNEFSFLETVIMEFLSFANSTQLEGIIMSNNKHGKNHSGARDDDKKNRHDEMITTSRTLLRGYISIIYRRLISFQSITSQGNQKDHNHQNMREPSFWIAITQQFVLDLWTLMRPSYRQISNMNLSNNKSNKNDKIQGSSSSHSSSSKNHGIFSNQFVKDTMNEMHEELELIMVAAATPSTTVSTTDGNRMEDEVIHNNSGSQIDNTINGNSFYSIISEVYGYSNCNGHHHDNNDKNNTMKYPLNAFKLRKGRGTPQPCGNTTATPIPCRGTNTGDINKNKSVLTNQHQQNKSITTKALSDNTNHSVGGVSAAAKYYSGNNRTNQNDPTTNKNRMEKQLRRDEGGQRQRQHEPRFRDFSCYDAENAKI